LVIVDGDPLACSLEDLPATRLLRTLFGERVVYDVF
jgi:predicted amidohydrolase YtcJ